MLSHWKRCFRRSRGPNLKKKITFGATRGRLVCSPPNINFVPTGLFHLYYVPTDLPMYNPEMISKRVQQN